MITPQDIIVAGIILAIGAAVIWIFPVLPISTKERMETAKAILFMAISIIIIGALGLTGLGEWVEKILYTYIFTQ